MSAQIFNYGAFPHEEVTHCPACGMYLKKWWMEGEDRYGYWVYLVTCARCNLTYLKERMDRAGYDYFYAGPYRRLTWSKAFPGVPFDANAHYHKLVAGQQIYAGLLLGWLKHFPVPARPHILDAGGSTGVVGELAGDFFNARHVTVLDPAAQELPAGRIKQTGERVIPIQGYLEDPIPGGPYDLILCCETMDHLLDPKAALANMRDVLAPGGLLYVDVVDKSTWAVHEGSYKIDHPLYWSKRSLMHALNAAGFSATIQKFMHSKRWKVRAVCQVNPSR